MEGEWQYIPFTEAVSVNPRVKLKRGETYPFVDMQSLDPSKPTVAPPRLRKFTGGGSKFEPYDTLMARITPCLENGKIAQYVPKVKQHGPAFGSTEFIVIRGKEGVTDNDFAFFLTRWSEFRSFAIAQMSGSSGRQRVPAESLAGFEVPVPPLPEQRAIARILGTLGDRVELNRRMNETLEAMAQALFKSWFVDFDPVMINAIRAGNPVPDKFAERAAHYRDNPDALGLPEHILRLFPDRFVDSELGPIPEGWEVGKVSDLGEVICGKTPPTKDKSNYGKDVPFITISDMHGNVYVTSTSKYLSKKGADSQKNKYIPSNSICVSCIATPGLVVLTSELSQTNQQINTVVPKRISHYYAFCALKRLGDEIRLGGSGGSVFSNLSKSRFSALRILLPSDKSIEEYHRKVKEWYERILTNENESRTLAALRDTLLPKLISGELRVPDVEKILEDKA